jgi:hypothetical protein
MRIYRPWLTPNQNEVLKATGTVKEITYDTIEYDGILKPRYQIDGHGYILEALSETKDHFFIIDDIHDYEQIKDLIIDHRIKVY